jgi:hypothetical protein
MNLYTEKIKAISKAKIKKAQFPIMAFTDARGVIYKAEIKKKVKKWKAGKGQIRKKEIVTGIVYKRVGTIEEITKGIYEGN